MSGGGGDRIRAVVPEMTEFKPLTYDALTIGEEFVSDAMLVTPEDVETYAFAVGDDHPWFSGPSPFGGAVAHPTFAANQSLRRSCRPARQDAVRVPGADPRGYARAVARPCHRQVRAAWQAIYGDRVRHGGRGRHATRAWAVHANAHPGLTRWRW